MNEPADSSTPSPAPKTAIKVYLESRYRKLERGLPQTIFYCPECKGDRRRARGCSRCEGFGKLTKDSVQELIARKAVPFLRGKRGKFHGAGREDIDVLMLGQGRPFVFEILGSRRPDVDLSELDQMIRDSYEGRIELAPFRRVERARVPYWKEAKFDKAYRVTVAAEGSLDPSLVEALVGQRITLAQRTPTRVAHRRADLSRERLVEVLLVRDVAEQQLVLDIRCNHGTYVKEWVSGDEGRTDPSLTSHLGVPCTCAQLDVLEIFDPENPELQADPTTMDTMEQSE